MCGSRPCLYSVGWRAKSCRVRLLWYLGHPPLAASTRSSGAAMTSAPHVPTPEEFAALPRPVRPQLVIESKDRRRVWTITQSAAGFDVNGIRNDNETGWSVAGHNHFETEAGAISFARSICGLPPLERETA